jgi:Tol biopolymer transport system component
MPGPATPTGGGQDLALMDLSGSMRPLGLPRSTYVTPRVSPNGRSLAVGVETGAEADLWIHHLEGSDAARRLTFGGHNRFPVWSPDGQRVAFQSDRDGDVAIFVQRADGSEPAERLTKPDAGTSHWPYSWSRDGRLLFGVENANRRWLWTFSVADRRSEQFDKVESRNAVLSPDGHWVAYVSANGPVNSLFVQPFPPTGATYLVSRPETQGNNPFWSPDGTQLFYTTGPGSFVVSKVTTQPAFSVGVATPVPAGGRFAQPTQREVRHDAGRQTAADRDQGRGNLGSSDHSRRLELVRRTERARPTNALINPDLGGNGSLSGNGASREVILAGRRCGHSRQAKTSPAASRNKKLLTGQTRSGPAFSSDVPV